ncbi:MAG: SURF1 family protein [Rhodobacteraceae bacterium]|nr:SURF1 family protein [Paracoccaceae bacterium]
MTHFVSPIRYIFPAVFAAVGVILFLNLGLWQLQRLEWKNSIIHQINHTIGDTPVPVPTEYTPEEHNYLPVKAKGLIRPETILYLTSIQFKGPGYRVISPFEFDNRRILIDRGFVLTNNAKGLEIEADVELVGNLHWPKEVDLFTPEPEGNLWFAREVEKMAKALGTEPLMIVVRTISSDHKAIQPLAITSEGIPNNHLGYAIQWFALIIVWLILTGWWVSSLFLKNKST